MDNMNVVVLSDDHPVACFQEEATAELFVQCMEEKLGIDPEILRIKRINDFIE